ncbi:interleukin-17C [Carassius auratus]|uniref:Interleukin-17C n=1 Tax=Carassius auratus TaxID=7957 RepID=A0A6P6LPH0_CARAU|nr:interleukin-17C-like [Carassius auratus]XP_052387569.1 interleukin-17C [Carassius gibelio]
MWSPLFFGIVFFLVSENIVKGTNLGCFSECEHGFKKIHKLLQSRHHHKHARLPPVHHKADSCGDFVRSSSALNDRSLSPWRLRIVENADMYPSKYEEAECLCEGCIINGVENMTYNSVPVNQTHLFLKKVPCPSDPKKYSLEYKLVSVTVACTCAVPKQ